MLSAAALVGAPETLSAHGREPEVLAIGSAADAPTTLLAVSSFGLWRSEDDGASWDFVCFDAYGTDERDNPAMIVLDGGEAVLGNFSGVWRSDASVCDWTQPEAMLTSSIVAAIARVPGTDTLVAIQSTGTTSDERVWWSVDEGRTWSERQSAFPGALVRHVVARAAASTVLYASGHRPLTADNPTPVGVLYTSEDDGVSWRALEVPYLQGEQGLHVLAVDPSDVDRVWVATTLEDGDIEHRERLLLSEDGGQTLTTVGTFTRVDALVVDPGSGRRWLGGERLTGLWTDGGDGQWSQQQAGYDVSALHLRPDDATLWLGGKPLREDFAIARSDDGGASIEPVLVRGDIRRRARCDAESTVERACGESVWFDLVSDLDLDPSVARVPSEDPEPSSDTSVVDPDGEPTDAFELRDASTVPFDDGAAHDASVVGEPASSDDGCGCAVRREEGPWSPWGKVLLLTGLIGLIRRWGTRP